MVNEALESIRNLGNKKLAILAIAGLVVLVGVMSLALSFTTGSLTPIYSNLSLDDSNKIVQELETQSIPYKIAANGTQVLVPSDQVLRLRMKFAEDGIPSDQGATIGYEIFDKDEKLGSSSFVQNMNQLRALEGELSRTISSLQQIKSARVHLVIPKQELFRKDRNEPTASIQVSLKGADRLSGGEVAAIRYLVATAVPGLVAENVTIVDNKGVLLAKGGVDSNDPAMFASNAQEYKTNYENNMRGRVEDMLEKYVGLGNVQAQISADIDFSREVTNSETYDPESQVARSIQTSEESEVSSSSNGGDVSVANNLPGETAAAGGAGAGDKSNKTEEVTNFEISKTTKNLISETGVVKKLSIAVLVDGNYEENAETGEMVYKERSPEEVKKLEALVKSAVGYDEKRGDSITVSNLQFSSDFGGYKKETLVDWIKNDLQSVVQILVMGLVAIMVILMVVRPLVKRALEVNAAQTAALEGGAGTQLMLTGPGAAGVPAIADQAGGGAVASLEGAMDDGEGFSALSGIKGPSKPASLRRINEIIGQNPEDCVAALRNWMYGEQTAAA